MKKLLLAFLSSSLLVAENEFDLMLDKYNEETQLYKDTLKESAGIINLFTREDLDNMQAHTLNDVLKTIKFFNIQTSRMGSTQLIQSGASSKSPAYIRIFINSHELSNVTFGNSMAQYGSMNLYYIDHIEVYQAVNSINFGSEAGAMVVKLYTKDPKRENGIFAQITLDSEGSTRFNAISAFPIDKEYSYLLNVDVDNKNSKEYDVKDINLQKDTTRSQIFFQFKKKDDYSIDIGSIYEEGNPFAVFSLTPKENQTEMGYTLYADIVKKFKKNITFTFTSSIDKVFMDYIDENFVTFTNGEISSNIDIALKTLSTKTTLKQKYNFSNHSAFLATSFSDIGFEVNKFDLDLVKQNNYMVDIHRDLFSLYGEDVYSLSESSFLVAALKYDRYELEKNSDDTLIYRVGYIYKNNSISTKLFAFSKMIEPTLSQLYFSPTGVNANEDLDPLQMNLISGDILFTDDNYEFSFGVANIDISDGIIVDKSTKKYINYKHNINFKRFFTKLDYSFDKYNNFSLEYFKLFKDDYYSPNKGFYFKLDNEIGDLNIHNEIVYRSSYRNEVGIDIDSGYDYSLALTYKYSNRTTFKLKGENLLDKASETSIYDAFGNSFLLPTQERRVLASMEYSFK